MSLPRRLALLLMAAIAFASPRWGGAQSFEFHAPLSASDAKTPAVMRDLAERLLPVYQDSDPDRYLANLSVLQLTAGDYSAAVESRESLRERRRRADSGRPVVRGRVLDLYARAMAIETDSHVPFSEAFAKAYQEVFSKLSDHDAFLLSGWLSAAPQEYQESFQRLLDEQRSKDIVNQQEAETLLSAFVYFEAYGSAGTLGGSSQCGGRGKPLQGGGGHHQSARARKSLGEGRAAENGRCCAACIARGRHRPTHRIRQGKRGAWLRRRVRGSAPRKGGSFRPLSARRRGGPGGHRLDCEATLERRAGGDVRRGLLGLHGLGGRGPHAAGAQGPRGRGSDGARHRCAMSGSIFQNSGYRWSLEVANTKQALEASFGDDAIWRALDEKWYRSGRRYRDLGSIYGKPNPVFIRWLNHPSYDRFWQVMIPYRKQFSRIDFPVLTMTGYFAAAEPAALYYFAEHHRYNPTGGPHPAHRALRRRGHAARRVRAGSGLRSRHSGAPGFARAALSVARPRAEGWRRLPRNSATG